MWCSEVWCSEVRWCDVVVGMGWGGMGCGWVRWWWDGVLPDHVFRVHPHVERLFHVFHASLPTGWDRMGGMRWS